MIKLKPNTKAKYFSVLLSKALEKLTVLVVILYIKKLKESKELNSPKLNIYTSSGIHI